MPHSSGVFKILYLIGSIILFKFDIMRPTELKDRLFKLPKHSNYNIIILTASSVRHKRFALRMQREFSDLVVAWYEYDNTVKSMYESKFDKKIKIKGSKSNRIFKIIRYVYKTIKSPKS